jgi:hypothetical protein
VSRLGSFIRSITSAADLAPELLRSSDGAGGDVHHQFFLSGKFYDRTCSHQYAGPVFNPHHLVLCVIEGSLMQ